MYMLSSAIVPYKKIACKCNQFSHDVKSVRQREETYYDVLYVRKDCTTQDIRNAFLRLSKKYHPDVKENAANSEKFLKISEAYKTLIKPQARKEYDLSLTWSKSHEAGQHQQHSGFHQPWEIKPDYNPNPGHYYGIKGIKRVSNWHVALILIAIGICGAVVGFSSVKHSFETNRELQDRVSAEASSHHAAVVSAARRNGNEEQLRSIMERLTKNRLTGDK